MIAIKRKLFFSFHNVYSLQLAAFLSAFSCAAGPPLPCLSELSKNLSYCR